ncbi:MAG: hypothetical protein KDB33_10400 [Acidimicrobiales bacterium]|nr:hypothetical protein [Acidimicrobiales bacterium]
MTPSNHLAERPHRVAWVVWLALLSGAWVTVVVVPTPVAVDDPFTVVFAGVRLGAAVLAARATVATIAVAVARAARSASAARLALRSAPRSLRPIVQRQLAIAVATGSALVAVPGVAGASAVVAAGVVAPRDSGTSPPAPEPSPPAMWRLEEPDATPSSDPGSSPSPGPEPSPSPSPSSEPNPADADLPRSEAEMPRSEPGSEAEVEAGAGVSEASPHGSPPGGDASVPPSERPAVPPGDRTWVVARGEHLWSIAADVQASRLGRRATVEEVAHLHTALIEQNRSRLADPGNPDLIFAGQELIVPEAP